MSHFNYNQYLLPIKIAMIYSVATVILYQFGPINYPDVNRFHLYFFLFISNFAMYQGFKSGVRKHNVISSEKKLPVFPIDKLLNVLFIISVILFLPKFMIKTGYYSINVDRIVSDAILFFYSALDLYQQKIIYSTKAIGFWQYINYIVVLGSPFIWAYTSLALLFWRRLSSFKKLLTVVIWSFGLLEYICTGTNVGLFDFFLMLGIILAIKSYLSFDNFGSKKNRINKKPIVKSILILMLAIFAVLWIFDISMGSRIGESYHNSTYIGNHIIQYNDNSIFLTITPRAVHPVLSYITKYVAQPYTALSFLFDVPFKTTFGFGYSWFLLDNMGIFSDALWNRTYCMQLEQMLNYNHAINWHTAYAWFANDVSLLGVPILFYFLFTLFGKAWRRFVNTFNIVSFLQFMLFVKMIIYISANNQVFQSYETFLAFWILLFLNSYSKRYDWINYAVKQKNYRNI